MAKWDVMKSKATRQEIKQVAALPPEQRKETANLSKKVHVANNSGKQEWYTPEIYLRQARSVLEEIDLDPASSDAAQVRVQAVDYYTADDSGLEHDWYGTVWLNPPYSAGLVDRFVDKLCEHVSRGDVTAAILLVNNATETKWFQQAACMASAICFPSGRIKYLDVTGEPKNSPLQGQAFIYFGDEPERFAGVFKCFGFCVDVRYCQRQHRTK